MLLILIITVFTEHACWFSTNLSNFIGYSATPMFVDETGPWNTNLYYKVSATDMGVNLDLGQLLPRLIAVNRPPQVFDVAISPAFHR